ncbi:hypothetical protein KTD55_33130 [Burkholderia gladioli]|uniref:hypothetical protein n=1 Tax=Burkholderia gladioli TaxID=28095 RepID=UPI001C24FB58|nr:hypothetical protein [Burkholderia gladioli]MBU9218902.1 hypothetical protein [Burkholderia gladioli]
MSEPTKTEVKGWVGALLSLLDSDQRQMIGLLVVILAFMAFGMAPVFLANFLTKPSNHCWDVKEVAGAVMKVNACTGETEVVSVSASPASASKAK